MALAMGSTIACSRSGASWRYLTDAEAATLTAICDQLIPPDQDPGGGWAGAPVYIDRQLTGKFREHRPAYEKGLKEADRRAGGNFAQASRETQLAVLKAMEKAPETKAFFNLVLAHTMQGFYGNPRHGGNREYCSWRMLGVPPLPVRGRAHYDFTKPDLSKPALTQSQDIHS